MAAQDKILSVPTNIITGFLGVGKTSAVMQLLKQKPKDERWAILVNEFGEIGVDGSLLSGAINGDEKVFIEEVPGGCMCCASQIPMQIALNKLLKKAKPHRLLIEPTGLGHPKEVLQVLTNEHYQDVLNIENIFTLVDARNLSDSRYTDHDVFNQQIELADVLVGNKADLYTDNDKKALADYAALKGKAQQNIVFTEQGMLSLESLAGKTSQQQNSCGCNHSHHHTHDDHTTQSAKQLEQAEQLAKVGIVKARNHGEGFESVGWCFSSVNIFDRVQLQAQLKKITATRVKGVFITSDGVFSYNNTSDNFSEKKLVTASESRIEIIADSIDESWQQQLVACVINA